MDIHVALDHLKVQAVFEGPAYDDQPLIDPQQGVVRVSLVHYNTEEEVEALITALNDVLLG